MTSAFDVDVLYVGFVTGHGGDALQMVTLADGIRRTGLRTRILVPRVPDSAALERRCAELGLDCERTPLLAAGMDGPRQSVRGLLRLLRANRAPVVHFHTGNSYLPRSLALCLELIRGNRWVATLQSPVETIVPGSLRARTWAFFANRHIAAVISPSDHGTAFQQRCGVDPARTLTMRNAVDVERFASGDPAGPRAVLGLSPEDELVLFSSRLDPEKDPVLAVDAFARVAGRFPNAHLAFVGKGSEEDAVRAAAARHGLAHRVHLTGYQTNIPDWLAAATIWFLPTQRENFSVALLEALASGCPVLSTDCRGNDEVLIQEENALVFPVGDLDRASDGLARLLADAELRKRLAASGRRTAELHSADFLAHATRALYDSMAGPALCKRDVMAEPSVRA